VSTRIVYPKNFFFFFIKTNLFCLWKWNGHDQRKNK
jgi:hypothetical protein